MSYSLQIGDFDIDIGEVLLVHKCTYENRYKYNEYKNGRNVSGLVYCISGEALYDFGGEKLKLESGEAIFLPEKSAYTIQSCSDEPFLHITANFKISNAVSAHRTVVSEILKGGFKYVSSGETSTAFKELLERLVSVWQNKNHGYGVLAKSVLYEILYLYFSDAGKHISNKCDYIKLLPAKKVLDEQYMESISVGTLAGMCGLSETHFRRLFVKLSGLSPTEYRLNKRILKAKDLLLSGDFSVAETALAVGFEDANYFSRIFKAHTGVSPGTLAKSGWQSTEILHCNNN